MSEPIKTTVMRIVDEMFKPHRSIGLADMVKQPDYSFRDLSDSSLKLVEFCMRLEEALGIEIEFSDLLDNPTFEKFTTWLSRQKKAG